MGKKIQYYIVMGVVTVTHFFVTFVVALFMLSTFNILNERTLHLVRLEFIEILITALIFIASTVVFIRSFKKTALFVKETFFTDIR